MCIIIDTNVFGPVFDSKNAQYNEFEPIFDWVYNGKGKFIYGGSKYLEELSGTKFLSIFVQLNKIGKAIAVKEDLVDRETDKVKKLLSHKNFNDQHLVGLVLASGCILICSLDKKSYPFITNKIFYKSPQKKPKIYSGRKNANLLNDNNIVEICKPCNKLTTEEKKHTPLSTITIQ
jgi:hypothetical protein